MIKLAHARLFRPLTPAWTRWRASRCSLRRILAHEPTRVCRQVTPSKNEPHDGDDPSPPIGPSCARSVRLLRANRADHASDTAAWKAVAPKPGCSPDNLRAWCQQADRDAGPRRGLKSTEKERIKEPERKVWHPARRGGQCLSIRYTARRAEAGIDT